MANFFTGIKNRFEGQPWLLAFNALGAGLNVILLMYFVVLALVALAKLNYYYAFYIAPFWILWLVAAIMHVMIIFHFPSGIADNLIAGFVGIAGSVLAAVSWGYYWPLLLGCAGDDKSSLDSMQLATCTDGPWLVWLVFFGSGFVIALSAATAAICIGNTIIASTARKAKRLSME